MFGFAYISKTDRQSFVKKRFSQKAMERIKIVSISFMLILFCSTSVIGQYKKMMEEEVPFRVQSFFYSKYNNVQNVAWGNLDEAGKQLFKADFEKDGDQMSAVLNKAGRLQEEIITRKKAKVDPILSAKSLLEYPEGKVIKEVVTTKFSTSSVSKNETQYVLSIKVGKEIVLLRLDHDKNVLNDDDQSGLAVN